MTIISSSMISFFVILAILVLRETPTFLFKKGRMGEMIDNLVSLAKINGTAGHSTRLDIYNLIFENQKISNFLSTFQAKIQFTNTKESEETEKKGSFLQTLFKPLYIY